MRSWKKWTFTFCIVLFAISCADKTPSGPDPFIVDRSLGLFWLRTLVGNCNPQILNLSNLTNSDIAMSPQNACMPNLKAHVTSTYDNHLTHCTSGPSAYCKFTGFTFTVYPIDSINGGTGTIDNVWDRSRNATYLSMTLSTAKGNYEVYANK